MHFSVLLMGGSDGPNVDGSVEVGGAQQVAEPDLAARARLAIRYT